MIAIRVEVDRDLLLSLMSLFTVDRDQGWADRDHSQFLGQFVFLDFLAGILT